MALRIPRLNSRVRIADRNGYPTREFHMWWGTAAKAIEDSFNQLAAAVAATAAAQAAATAAQVTANAAAAAAATASATATIGSSGTIGASLQGFDDTLFAAISITTHTRVYGDGASVSVTAGNVFGLAFSTLYYVYYDDPTRAGGAVTYFATTSQTTATQTGARHLVGQVQTPASGALPNGGFYVGAPGIGGIYQ